MCFEDFAKELQQLKDRKIETCYFREKPFLVDLHIFSDASLEAMCVVAYLRAESDSDFEVSFAIGKCRIAPMKQKTVRQLELQAALYAVRMKHLILEGQDINFGKVYHRTDSLTRLQSLCSAHKKQQVFVANRLSEILNSSTVGEWRHLRRALNPAEEWSCLSCLKRNG